MPLPFIPAGTWYQIPSSRLDTSGVAGNPPFNGGLSGIMSYSGGAYDTSRDRLMIYGGGHGDYAGNEIYAFNMKTLAWSRLRNTFPGTSQADTSPAIESSGYYPTTLGGSTPDQQQPRSQHTRGSLEYHPGVDAMCVMGIGAMYPGGSIAVANTDIYKIATNTWERKQDHPDFLDATGGSTTYCGYDSVSGKIFAHGNKSGKRLIMFDASAGTWTLRGPQNFNFYNTDTTGVLDPVARRLVQIGQGQVTTWDIDDTSGTVLGISRTTTGPQNVVNAAGPGLAFDPIENHIVGWVGGTSVYTLNLSTFVWTERVAATGNTVTPTSPNLVGTFGRFRYSPSLNLYFVVNAVNESIYAYKLNPAPITDPDMIVLESTMATPADGATYNDPEFGTQGTRHTGTVPEYSELQAWNSDGSLILVNNNGPHQIRDATTWALRHTIDYGTAPDNGFALRWSPTQPYVLYYLDFADSFGAGAVILKYTLTPGTWTRTRTLVRHFPEYIRFHEPESFEEMSENGQFMALLGKKPVTYPRLAEDGSTVNWNPAWGATPYVTEGFVYDIINDVKHAGLEFPIDPVFGPRQGDHIVMTPNGQYVLVWWGGGVARYRGIEAFDLEMNYLGKVSTAQTPHGMPAQEVDGSQVVVYDNANDPDFQITGGHDIVKAKVPVGVIISGGVVDKPATLAGGYSVALLTVDWQHNMHISATNRTGRGWVVVGTYSGKPGYDNGWQAFEQELFRVYLDSTATVPHVQRFSHHRSHASAVPGRDPCAGVSESSFNYWAQPHATISPDGSKIFFGTNYGAICTNPFADGVVLSSVVAPVTTLQTSRTQQGASRVRASTSRGQTGRARVGTTASRTEIGLARVLLRTVQAEQGTSRVTARISVNQTGLASVTMFGQISRAQTGVAHMLAPGQKIQTQAGRTRITASAAKQQNGTGDIKSAASRIQQGLSHVLPVGTTVRPTAGRARISAKEGLPQGETVDLAFPNVLLWVGHIPVVETFSMELF